MVRTRTKMVSSRESLAKRLNEDPEFRDEWARTAVARAVATALVKYRGEQGLTQTQLAERLGMAQTQVGRLELGEHTPTIEMLFRLAHGLGQGFVVAILPQGRDLIVSAEGCEVLEDVTLSQGMRVVAAAG